MSTNAAGEPLRRGKFTPNVILLIFISFVITFTGIVVFTSSNKEVIKWDLTTPQGVVQTYLTSIMNGDLDKAATLLARDSECSVQDLDRAFVQSEMGVYLSSTAISVGKASVIVKVDIPTGGLFAEYSTETHTLRLERRDERWQLVGIPWPLYDCGVNEK
ncbi:MAG: hypothetical protein H7227_08550 [Actinobacteria bacterium]|nr:hypothetical protein [Actinomycetota bacterium]